MTDTADNLLNDCTLAIEVFKGMLKKQKLMLGKQIADELLDRIRKYKRINGISPIIKDFISKNLSQ